MFFLVSLVVISIALVLLAERHDASRMVLRKVSGAYTQGTCRSYFFDIFFLLPLVGFLVELLTRRLNFFEVGKRRVVLYAVANGIFITIAGCLYFDLLNFSALTSILGHAEIWGGNRFMWNSGLEIIGIDIGKFLGISFPTYQNFFGFWNITGLFLLYVLYPVIMVVVGTRLYGLLCGYTEKQTGVSALFFGP